MWRRMEELSINLRLQKDVKIRDSLELIGNKAKFKYVKRKRGYLIVDDLDYSSTSEDDFAVSSQQDAGEESSIEETRDASVPFCQTQPNNTEHVALFADLNSSNPINSTLIESRWAAPISVYNQPLVSPIEGFEDAKMNISARNYSKKSSKFSGPKFEEIHRDIGSLETPKKARLATSFDIEIPHGESIASASKSGKGVAATVVSSDSEVEWIPNNCASQKNYNNEPLWLSQTNLKLKQISPKAYTPQNSEKFQRSFKRPVKSKLRTSSPDETKLAPKAKKSLIENLDLSSIASDPEYGDSLELVPRPPTPGTVNSDEIMPPDYTAISPPNQEACQRITRNSRTGDDLSQSDDVVEDDVIERLPSPVLGRKCCQLRVTSFHCSHDVDDDVVSRIPLPTQKREVM